MSSSGKRVTVPAIRAMKGRERIVMVTAYDAAVARLLDLAGVEILLVGDSLGMVVLGRDTTLGVTLDEVVHHTRAVRQGKENALLVADMPYLTYHISCAEAVRNAGRLIQEGGAEAVKIEGGRQRLEVLRALQSAEIPVMGHLGLTPQSYHAMGGFRVQGREAEQARQILEDARALEEGGVFAIVLEGMPVDLAQRITETVGVPTIGIGAGPGCDGQVLVVNDILGLGGDRVAPRFVRRYAELDAVIREAIGRFIADVKGGSFPSDKESYGPTSADASARPARTVGS